MTLHLGKTPHVEDPRDLHFATYTTELPALPPGPLGQADLIPADGWLMLGNGPDDTVAPGFQGGGDCVFAGGDHETMLWNRERQRTVTFTGADAIGDYSAVTGYVIGDESTDRGTDVRNALLYRRKTGLKDATGKRHKIAAFTALRAGNLTELQQAIYLFSVAGIGIDFPSSAMDQFDAGKPWDVVRGSSSEGGHYIPISRWDPKEQLFYAPTWGRLQPITPRFLAKYMDEGYAILSSENRLRGKTLERFSGKELLADLGKLAA